MKKTISMHFAPLYANTREASFGEKKKNKKERKKFNSFHGEKSKLKTFRIYLYRLIISLHDKGNQHSIPRDFLSNLILFVIINRGRNNKC